MYLQNRMLNFFRKQRQKGACCGMCSRFGQAIFLPFDIIRLYTIPMSNEDDWDKKRATIISVTYILSFLYYFGLLQPAPVDTTAPVDPTTQDSLQQNTILLIVGLVCMVPGAILGLCIYFCTKATQPPRILVNIFAIMAFVQSIAVINFSANCIVDLLVLLGFITSLP